MNFDPIGSLVTAGVTSVSALYQALVSRGLLVPAKVQENLRAKSHRNAVVAVVAPMNRWLLRRLERLPRWVFAFCLFALAVGAARAADQRATLQAIHQLENPRNLAKPGPFGELGAYQFRSTTWRMHTTIPFQRALDRNVSDAVAAKHYDYLRQGLERAGVPATTYNIALAWNSGIKNVVKGTAPRVAHAYAERASNLAEVFASEKRLAAR